MNRTKLAAFLDELQKIAALNAKTMLPTAGGAGTFGTLSKLRGEMEILKPLKNMPSEQAVHEMMNPVKKAVTPVSSHVVPSAAAPAMTAHPPSVQVTPSSAAGAMGHTIPAPATAANSPTMLPSRPPPAASGVVPRQTPPPAPAQQMAATVPPPRRQTPMPMPSGPSLAPPGLPKFAGSPPPLPAGAIKAVKNPMADALFSGMKSAPKTDVMKSLVKKGSEEKTALGKMLGELVKKQTDPARLANISRLATSRGAQLATEGAPAAKKYLAVGTAAAQRMSKAAFVGEQLSKLAPMGGRLAEGLKKYDDHLDLAGLGVLALPGLDTLQHQARMAPGERDSREMAHAGLETAGLGVLAAPVAAKLLSGTPHV